MSVYNPANKCNPYQIAIDLDDTLSCFGETWLAMYNEKSGDNLTLEQITDWEIDKFILPEWRGRVLSEEIVYSEGFYDKVPVKEGAVEFMRWACDNFRAAIVSATRHDAVADKARWIQKHFPFFDIKDFIICHDKQAIKAHVLIDDGLHNLYGFRGGKILIDRPWNQESDTDQITENLRVDNLMDIQRLGTGFFLHWAPCKERGGNHARAIQ